MAAFFALPISDFFRPGEELFHLPYAITYIVAVTAAEAIPLIVVARYVNPILSFTRSSARIFEGIIKAPTSVTKKVPMVLFKVIKTIFRAIFAIFEPCYEIVSASYKAVSKELRKNPIKHISAFILTVASAPFHLCRRAFRWLRTYCTAKKLRKGRTMEQQKVPMFLADTCGDG